MHDNLIWSMDYNTIVRISIILEKLIFCKVEGEINTKIVRFAIVLIQLVQI